MTVVVDSSMALSWCLEDERTFATNAVLERVSRSGAVVPPLWRFEVANALQVALKKGRTTTGLRKLAFADFELLSITTDGDSDALCWSASVSIAERHGLTVYDAVYLELALRRQLPLATLDRALVAASVTERVEVIGAYGRSRPN